MAARSETPRTRSTSKHAAWQALEHHHETVRGLHLRNLFADDPTRGKRMTAEAAGVYLDYSKNRINDETLTLLIELAEQSGLRARIDAMFRVIEVDAGRLRSHPLTARRIIREQIPQVQAPHGLIVIPEGLPCRVCARRRRARNLRSCGHLRHPF